MCRERLHTRPRLWTSINGLEVRTSRTTWHVPSNCAELFSCAAAVRDRRGLTSLKRSSSAVRRFGPTHPLTAGSLVQLAKADLASGDRAMAVTNALAAEEMGRNHLRFTVRYLPEQPAIMRCASVVSIFFIDRREW